ncbi:MAG: DUF202 domain-containing protein [Alphaproteobacteria bacterium]|nr:MAG: DUF202 domain-containing protein [Alphaproteobacteria bacterium]
MIRNFADHASNERTFLAWVRTAIAIAGFGIAGARVGGGPASPWADFAVLGTGALLIILAYVRMRLIRARLDSDGEEPDESSAADAALVLVVIALFAMLGAFGLRLSV